MIDELVTSFHNIPKEVAKIMDNVRSIDNKVCTAKEEIEKLTSEFSAKLKENNKEKPKKRKRPIKDRDKRGPALKKKKREPTPTELEGLGNQLLKRHETIMEYSEKKMEHAKQVQRMVQESIDKLDKKLFDVTRAIRRTVHNGNPKLRKPITYQVLETVLQSELYIAKMKQQYDEYNLLEKQDVVIHLRSLGRGDKPEIDLWERKVKHLPDDSFALKNTEEKKKPLRKNNHDRKTPRNSWCFCNQKASGQMIGCDDDDCDIEWFHFICVGLKVKPAGEWICARCQSRKKKLQVKQEEGIT